MRFPAPKLPYRIPNSSKMPLYREECTVPIGIYMGNFGHKNAQGTHFAHRNNEVLPRFLCKNLVECCNMVTARLSLLGSQRRRPTMCMGERIPRSQNGHFGGQIAINRHFSAILHDVLWTKIQICKPKNGALWEDLWPILAQNSTVGCKTFFTIHSPPPY